MREKYLLDVYVGAGMEKGELLPPPPPPATCCGAVGDFGGWGGCYLGFFIEVV